LTWRMPLMPPEPLMMPLIALNLSRRVNSDHC
jgi:hypothetical protein